MNDRMIVTNGDVAVQRLQSAGIEADFLPWLDALHDGPVCPEAALEDLSAVRAAFLAEDLGTDLPEVATRFAARDAAIRDHAQYREIELWFEHDLYDQLQLLQVLDFLAGDGRRSGVLLVQAEDYLGRLDLDRLRALEGTREPVALATTDIARTAWHAFTDSTPDDLARCAAQGSDDLPFLAPALLRLLAEFPAPESGLSLTEERILDALGEGNRPVGKLFGAVADREEAQFLGDLSFFRRLDGLAFAPTPLIEGLPFPSQRCAAGPEGPDYRAYAAAEPKLTPAGEAALAGRFDHAVENNIDRWIGGTHLRADNLWRWERAGNELIEPAGLNS